MQPYLNTASENEEVDPQEEAMLREFVGATAVVCVPTAVQTAVTTAKMVYQQDWSQEARKLLRELGMPATPQTVMYAAH